MIALGFITMTVHHLRLVTYIRVYYHLKLPLKFPGKLQKFCRKNVIPNANKFYLVSSTIVLLLFAPILLSA